MGWAGVLVERATWACCMPYVLFEQPPQHRPIQPPPHPLLRRHWHFSAKWNVRIRHNSNYCLNNCEYPALPSPARTTPLVLLLLFLLLVTVVVSHLVVHSGCQHLSSGARHKCTTIEMCMNVWAGFASCLFDEVAHWLRRLWPTSVCPTPAATSTLQFQSRYIRIDFLHETFSWIKTLLRISEKGASALQFIAWAYLFVHWTVAIGCLW